mgnify:CR=1 FL=1
MGIKICPHCVQRYMVNDNSGDYEHQCNSGNPVLDQDDILVIGDWVDYTGSDYNTKLNNVLNRMVPNTLFGGIAQIDGDKNYEYTVRGNKALLYRQRQHIHSINNSNSKCH